MLTNPLGLLALLGIPAVLAIHFLQRKAIELPVSTLFLLERTQRDAASGRKFDRLIPSIPLWMQLLAVLLLTWFLVEPRYPKSGTVQRVAVVLDSSASMTVFRQESIKRLTEALPSLKGSAETLELTVLESVPTRPRLFSGTSIDDFKVAMEGWNPRDGMNDPTASLRLARSLVSSEGSVIYVTDTPSLDGNGEPVPLPFNACILSAGKIVENTGFTGVTFSQEEGALVWKAMVRNYGTSPAERTWSLQSSQGATEPRSFSIAPGALVTLQAAFPKGAENVRIVLSPDAFTLDDVMPLVAPVPKPLNLFTSTSPAFSSLTEKLLTSLESAVPVNDAATADLAIASYDPLDPILPEGNSIIFVEDSTSAGAYLRGGIVAEPDRLLDGLNWQSLLVRETIQLDRMPTDRVLLWQEKRPLIFVREVPATSEKATMRQLRFNFDLRLSNALQQPAFIVLLHRFAETIREAKVAHVSANLETNQPLTLTTAPGVPLLVKATDPTGKTALRPGSGSHTPGDPGFLTATQGDKPLLTASLHFADTREADFSACAPASGLENLGATTTERHTKPDPYWQIWLMLLLATLLASWKFTKSRRSDAPTMSSTIQA
jgi:hypothetical protein